MKNQTIDMKKVKVIAIFVFLFMLVSSVLVTAVPSIPDTFVAAQPDGYTFEAKQFGDEKGSWTETSDGYAIKKDTRNQWTFAEEDSKGRLVPSTVKVSRNSGVAKKFIKKIKPNIPRTKEERKAAIRSIINKTAESSKTKVTGIKSNPRYFSGNGSSSGARYTPIITGNVNVVAIPVQFLADGDSWSLVDQTWFSGDGDLMDNSLNRTFDLSGLTTAYLRFKANFSIESNWDNFTIKINNSGSWIIIFQNDTSTNNNFIDFAVNLTPYAGGERQIKFNYNTDEAVGGYGVYIDDINLSEANFIDRAENNTYWTVSGSSYSPTLISSSKTKEYYENFLFNKSNQNSLNAYYNEVSYNQLNLTGTVASIVNSTHSMEYYGRDWTVGTDNYYSSIYELAREAVILANPEIDFSEYDQDNDGFIDHIIIIHAGSDQAAGGSSNRIWSHSWDISGYETVDAVNASSYTMLAEDSGLGTFAHEFFHDLGAPDLYNTVSGGTVSGYWDVMDYGGWSNGGNTPSHMSAYLKYDIDMNPANGVEGWLNITNYTSASNIYISQILNNTPNTAIRIPIQGDNEFFIVENRQKTGFDTYLPEAGILVWHVDNDVISSYLSSNSINGYTTKGYIVEKAGGSNSNAAYSVDDSQTIFNSSSSPSSNSNNGIANNISIITRSNEQQFMRADIFNGLPPALSQPIIAPRTPYENQSLNCSANITSQSIGMQEWLNISFTWFKNNIAVHDFDSNVSAANGTIIFTNVLVNEGNVISMDNWTCSARVNDGIYFSAWLNSSVVQINNSMVSMISGLAAINITNSSITWQWTNPQDSDFLESIVYIDNSLITSTSNNSYTASGFAANLRHTIIILTSDTFGNINTTISLQNNMTNTTLQNNRTIKISSVSISPTIPISQYTPASVYKNTRLNCSAIPYAENWGTEGESLNVSFAWYKNNILAAEFASNSSGINGSAVFASLQVNAGNVTEYSNWTCSAKADDGLQQSAWLNSSAIKVMDIPPATISSLAAASATNSSIFWSWTNPANFSKALIYFNDINLANTSDNFYNLTGLENITSYTIKILASDSHNNINITISDENTETNSTAQTVYVAPYTPPAAPSTSSGPSSSSSSGGGGGGGGSSSSAPPIEFLASPVASKTWSMVHADAENIFDVNNNIISATRVSFTSNAEQGLVTLTVRKIDSNPSSPLPSDFSAGFLEITNTVGNEQIAGAEIEFKVSKSLIKSSKISENDIVLYRKTSLWEMLDTSIISQNSEYVFYSAKSPGFSYFAISAKPDAMRDIAPVEEVPEQPEQAEETLDSQITGKVTKDIDERDLRSMVLAIALLAFILGSLIVILAFWESRRLKEKAGLKGSNRKAKKQGVGQK